MISDVQSDTDSWLMTGHRSRMPNVTLNQDDVKTEKVLQLNRERAGIQAAFTRTETYINNLLTKSDSSHSDIDKGLLSIETTFNNLKQKVAQLRDIVQDDTDECDRLNVYMEKMQDRLQVLKSSARSWLHETVKPGDSMSQAPSGKSSQSMVRAKKAALQVKMAALKKSQELKQRKLEIEMQEESLNMETELKATEAEERVLSEACGLPQIGMEHKLQDIKQETVPQLILPDMKLNSSYKSCTGNEHGFITQAPESENFQHELLHMLQLPRAEIPCFDGNPLKYWAFIRGFDNNIGNTSINDCAKLNRLMQYCTGSALEVIECCVIMEPHSGYAQARALLQERFGNQHVIAKAWIDKLTEGPVLKATDVTELRKYADSVRSCIVTLRAMGRMSEVDNQLRMKKIVEKLPAHIQARWRKQAVGFLKGTGEYPDIENLAEFIEITADEVNDPVFGIPTSSVRQLAVKQGVKRNPVSSFVVNESPKPRRSCRCCGYSHHLYRCDVFKKMNLKQRLEFIIKHRLCFNCFSSNHMSSTCPRNSMCDVDGCNRKHSNLLHDNSRFPVKIPVPNVMSAPCPDNNVTTNVNGNMKPMVKCQSSQTSAYGSEIPGTRRSRIALPIVPVCVKRNNDSDVGIQTYALLDPGSTNTFCSEELAHSSNLKGSEAVLSLNTLTDKNYTSQTEVVSFSISDLSGRETLKLSNVFVLPQMPVLDNCSVSQNDLDKWDHLSDISLPAVNGPFAKVTLLIGQDNPIALTPVDIRSGSPGEPYATRTVFDWAINGPLQQGKQQCMMSNFIQVGDSLESQVQRIWKLDNVGDGDPQFSFQDKQVLKLWDSTVEREHEHYKLPIPFKVNPPDLPNNYSMALSRLESLSRKLGKDDLMHQSYKVGIDEMVHKGYAEKIPEDELYMHCGPVWYLPHHVVTSEKKPGKFRIVFDCSAKFAGISLNDAVHQGPDLTNSLIGVLLRFREHKIAIAADIESMFHRVKVANQHRDVLRFLWWKKGETDSQVEIYRMTSHLFGGIWSSSCANYALKRVSADNVGLFDATTIQSVKEDFYVDDYLKSIESEKKAISLVQDICKLLQTGGFRVTKWISNSRNVLETIPLEERAKEFQHIDLCDKELPLEKALGVKWDTETDQLRFTAKPKDKPMTKRGIISVIASVYDPMGFLAPVILQAKKIFQEECRLHKDWDDPLEPLNMEKWSQWLMKLPHIEHLMIPRCIVPDDFGDVKSAELHHFTDASTSGYGAVSYIRLRNADDRIHCSFLIGKSRLAPIKNITIPRLELCAAVLGVKLDQMLRKELRIELSKSTFWSDSMIVLHYIRNDSQRYQTFVANRITQICELSSPSDWRYITSSLNPADDVSRGVDAEEILKRNNWFEGPCFLYSTDEKWPKLPDILDVLSQELESKTVNLVSTKADVSEPCTDRLMLKYSTWYRLKKAVAWMLRLKQCLLKRVRDSTAEAMISTEPIKVSEMKSAETVIIKYIQNSALSSEINSLMHTQPLKKTSPVYSLEPFLNSDGIMCVGGHLKHAPISDESKYQMILPKSHYVVTLIVRNSHELLGHSATEHVLSHVRQRFWIVSARRTIKRVLRDCVKCKRLQGQGCSQKMADLPHDRVTPGKPPFTYIGIDCFGPFFIKRGRSQVKRYGCIFTCLTTRAIHIEKLDTMETDSFINGLRRFESRRGIPELIRSDNGSNFKGAHKELKVAIQQWNQLQIENYMLQKNIQWIFNPPFASHMGGSWERQIRTVRKVLNALLYQHHCLHDEELSTLLCEVEAIVNSRPITVVPDNPHDLEPLTPNHILLLRSSYSLPPGKFCPQDVYCRRWRQVQFLADQFWKRWLKEYLPSLQIRQKWLKSAKNLSVGDIVLLVDEHSPRHVWPLARITQVFPGKDGLVRSVEVKTQNTLFVRPINKKSVFWNL